jgi:hypothetical protein
MKFFMKIRPVETELIHADGRTDRQTDRERERDRRTDVTLIVVFRNLAYLSKMKRPSISNERSGFQISECWTLALCYCI